MPITPLLKVKDVATRLGISAERVRGLILSGKLRACNLADSNLARRQWRVSEEALAAYIAARDCPKVEPKRPPITEYV